jgi:hypothetical protein
MRASTLEMVVPPTLLATISVTTTVIMVFTFIGVVTPTL